MKSLVLVFITVFGLVACSSYSVEESTLVTNELDSTIEMTVPASKVIMSIPKMKLVKQHDNPTNSYRYFYYWDKNEQLGISGWFESASIFKGTEYHWNEMLSSWKGNRPEDVKFETASGWDIISYSVKIKECSQSNIKAYRVQNGTWLEIHLSAFCREGSEKADLLSYLKKISVVDKPE